VHQEFGKELRLAAPPATVWNALLDFDRVASWLSIVRDVREIEPLRRYSALLEDRVGPFALRADLTVAVDASTEGRTMHVAVSGDDRQVASRIAATLGLAVKDDADGSAIAVTGRYEITGRIATLGAGAIRKKAEHVLDEFFANLARDLSPASAP